MLLVLLACAPDHPVRSPPDSKEDTGAPVDTAETGDTADTVDTGETADTVDTAPVDTGVLHADVVYAGVASTVDCGGGQGAFVHTFTTAIGDIAGEVECVSAAGDDLHLRFTSGEAATWTDPSAGTDFSWTSATGDTLYWGKPGTVTTSWSIALTTFERTTTKTLDLVGTFGGVWTDEAGAALGSIDATVSATLTCEACP